MRKQQLTMQPIKVRRIHQYKLRLDPSSDMVRLGFTEEEVRQALLQGNKKSSKSH